jgi:hypothetical protein
MPDDKLQMKIITSNSFQTIEEKLLKLVKIISKTEIDDFYKDILKVKISEDVSKRLITFFNKIKNSEKILYPLSQR